MQKSKGGTFQKAISTLFVEDSVHVLKGKVDSAIQYIT